MKGQTGAEILLLPGGEFLLECALPPPPFIQSRAAAEKDDRDVVDRLELRKSHVEAVKGDLTDRKVEG